MAVAIFKVEKEKIKEAKKILESNPYEKDSFARLGYKFKEAKYLGLEGEDAYIYIDVDEEKLPLVREKLKEVAVELEGEEKEKVKKAFEEEEAGAAAGIGAIFG